MPAIISRETYERVQAVMQVVQRRGLRRVRHEYLLEGLAVCACGRPIRCASGHSKYRRHAYYRCEGRWTRGERCALPMVRMDAADAAVWEAVAGMIATPGRVEAALGMVADAEAEEEAWQRDAAAAAAALGELRRREERMAASYAAGRLSDAAWDAAQREIARQREAWTRQAASAAQALAGVASAAHRTDTVLGALDELRGRLAGADFATRREIVELVVARVVVGPDGLDVDISLGRDVAPVVGDGTRTHHESNGAIPVRLRVVA